MTIDRQIFRQSDFIEVAVDNVIAALRDGGILVVLIVLLFLANLRAGGDHPDGDAAVACGRRARRCAPSARPSTR